MYTKCCDKVREWFPFPRGLMMRGLRSGVIRSSLPRFCLAVCFSVGLWLIRLFLCLVCTRIHSWICVSSWVSTKAAKQHYESGFYNTVDCSERRPQWKMDTKVI